MAKIINSVPDVFEIRRGGGMFTFVGIATLIPCLTIFSFAIAKKIQEQESIIQMCFLAIVFCSAGVGTALGRLGVIVDKRHKTITTWMGLIVPFFRTLYPLDDYNKVIVKKEIRNNKGSKYNMYVGWIVGTGKEIMLCEEMVLADAIKLVTPLAEFMKVPFENMAD